MYVRFLFTRKQRNGLFALLLLIVSVQFLMWMFPIFKKSEVERLHSIDVLVREIEAIKKTQEHKPFPKIYPFNPNYLTDYRGFLLGMSTDEIDRVLAHRDAGQWINSLDEFKQISGITDAKMEAIMPYLVLPPRPYYGSGDKRNTRASNRSSHFKKKDLNTATAATLQAIRGIGPTLSQRIIRYRNSHPEGFISTVQLKAVRGLSAEVIERIEQEFEVLTPRAVHKLNLNIATVEQLVQIEFIDYPLAYEIIDYRILHEGFSDLSELTKVKDFPTSKYDIIALYLSL